MDRAINDINEKNKVRNILVKAVVRNFDTLVDTAQNTIDWIVDNHKKSFDHILGLLQTPTPAFKTWNETQKATTQSGLAIDPEIFRNIPGVNTEIIQELIDLVQFSESVTEAQRRNILATAYLILGKYNEASRLLENES